MLSARATPSFARNSACRPQFYLDGARISLNEYPLGINELRKHEIAAIEMYSGPLQVPAQYNSSSSARCGVVLLRTLES